MAPGARSNFGAPMFEPGLFRKQMYYIEESTCDIVGIFGTRGSYSVPGELCPLSHLLHPCSAVRDSGVDLHDTKGVTRGLQRGHKSPAAESLWGCQITAGGTEWLQGSP